MLLTENKVNSLRSLCLRRHFGQGGFREPHWPGCSLSLHPLMMTKPEHPGCLTLKPQRPGLLSTKLTTGLRSWSLPGTRRQGRLFSCSAWRSRSDNFPVNVFSVRDTESCLGAEACHHGGAGTPLPPTCLPFHRASRIPQAGGALGPTPDRSSFQPRGQWVPCSVGPVNRTPERCPEHGDQE